MKEQQEIGIDPLLLLASLWRKKILILLVAIITGGLAFSYSSFIVRPQYTSTSRIYVVNHGQGEQNVLTNQALQAGSYLVKDYQEIILSQDVLEKVIANQKLTMTPKQLASKIRVSVPRETRIVSIDVKDTNPDTASQLANELRVVAAAKIKAVTKVSDVTTLEEARPALNPSSPNIRRNTILGVAGGAVLIIVLLTLQEILDDRIKRPEDVEEVLELPLLGVVPKV
jgi:chain length determinant protein